MHYENRPVPEGINVSHTHPLVEFGWLLLSVGVIITVLVTSLSLAAGWMAQRLPFAQEQQLADNLGISHLIDEGAPQVQAWLQQLADQLAQAAQLPDDMHISVHYVESPQVNAYATLGGNIVIFSGLLEKLHSENAVALVVAHEIAHVQHRDPIMALGRGTAVAVLISLFVGGGDSGMAQKLVGNIGLLTQLSFTRDQERAADQSATDTLLAHYGTLAGSMELFQQLATQPSFTPELLRSHPLTEKRLATLEQAAASHQQGRSTPFSLTAISSTKSSASAPEKALPDDTKAPP